MSEILVVDPVDVRSGKVIRSSGSPSKSRPKRRLAILSTHPIQYHVPWFRGLTLHPDIQLEVLYCHRATPQEQAKAGFGFEFDWDVSLLDGYAYRFLNNEATVPTINTFRGLDTPQIKGIIEGDSVDAVLINGWHYKSAWQAMRACWKTGTPVMVRSDSHLHTPRSNAKQMAKWPFYRWFIPKLDACVAVGSWSRDYFLHYGASPEKVFIVPHVVDDGYFSSEADLLRPHRNELREKWNLDSQAKVYLFAGKFVEKKRPFDFLDAIDRVVKRGARVAGLMVGDGPLRVSCEELVKEKHLPVTFAGFLNQSEITRAYVASDALVLPSDGGETWGLVVNEAMACGLPCFVSDHVGCAPDMISRDETGGVFPLGDTEALATLLYEYAQDGTQQLAYSRGARAKADSHSTGAAVEATAEALRAVCEMKG
jgi:glycosyltransferase involved in cell wall biosynthesis